MNRFPKQHWEHEQGRLACHHCDQILTEREAEHYWQRFPHGSFDPLCFDCASEVEVDVNEREELLPAKAPAHVLSLILWAAIYKGAELAGMVPT